MYDDVHPFVRWFAALHGRQAAEFENGEVVLDELGARRFAIGIDEDAIPMLGVQPNDTEVFQTVRWRKAQFLKQFRGRDWVGLYSPNVASHGEPQPLKLWIPVMRGILPAFKDANLKKLKLVQIGSQKGKPIPGDEPPFAELPLSIKNGTRKQ